MALFEIVTKSSFENVYLVEADSADEASAIVYDGDLAPDFFQKHLGETIEHLTDLCSGTVAESEIELFTSAIKNRGYC